MKIRVNKNDTDVASIKAGECFWYKGLLYMKIYGIVSSYNTAVLLSTGAYTELDPDTQVERQECMVVSTEEKTEKGKWEV